MAETVFHLMTVVRVSELSLSSGVFKMTGLVEKDSRGLQLCAADLGSRRSGAATVRMGIIHIDQFVYRSRIPPGSSVYPLFVTFSRSRDLRNKKPANKANAANLKKR